MFVCVRLFYSINDLISAPGDRCHLPLFADKKKVQDSKMFRNLPEVIQPVYSLSQSQPSEFRALSLYLTIVSPFRNALVKNLACFGNFMGTGLWSMTRWGVITISHTYLLGAFWEPGLGGWSADICGGSLQRLGACRAPTL